MPKPSPVRPAHRQDTVISILVAGTLRSEAPLKDMAGRVAGAAGGCETGSARGGGGGGGGAGPCAAAAVAAEAALPPALRALWLLGAFTVASRAAAPDGNAAPPGPAGGPHPIGAASSRPGTLHGIRTPTH